MQYPQKIRQAVILAAKERGVDAAASTWKVSVTTVRRWLASAKKAVVETVKPASGVTPEEARRQALSFYFTTRDYPSCCGASIAVGFRYSGKKPISPEAVALLRKRFNGHGIAMFGITNGNKSNGEYTEEVMRLCGWKEETHFGGNYSKNRLKSWIFVPDGRVISQPEPKKG